MTIEIGKHIKRGLEKKGMLQKDLAQVLKRSNSTISEWINGKKIPPANEFVQVVKLLDIVGDVFPEYDCQEGRAEKEKSGYPIHTEISRIWAAIENLEQKMRDMEKNGGNASSDILLEKDLDNIIDWKVERKLEEKSLPYRRKSRNGV